MSPNRQAGRVALVTGAAHGIGFAIARRLGREGARIVICDIDPQGANAASAELRREGIEVLAQVADVRIPAETDRVAAAAVAKFGVVDIVVCNAGLVSGDVIETMSDAQWDLVLDVSLRGAFNMLRSAAHALLAKQERSYHRKVLIISSVAGVYGGMTVNYSAAKSGQIGFAKALAREWADKQVNVNVIAPGRIVGTRIGMSSDRTKDGPDVASPVPKVEIPIGREGVPEDIAAAAAFLVSDEADFITAQVLEVHGGLSVVPKPPASLA